MWVLLDYRALLPCHRLFNFYKKTNYYLTNIFLFSLCKTSGKGSHRNQLKHCSVIKWGFLTTSKTSFTQDLVVNITTMYIFIFLGHVVPTTCYECWHSFLRFPPPCSETHLLRPTIWGLQQEYWVWFFITTKRCKYFFKHTSTPLLTGNISNCYTKALHNKILWQNYLK